MLAPHDTRCHVWKSSSGHASHVIGCNPIGICVFRVRRCHTLTCAAAPTVAFVWRSFETHRMSRVSTLGYTLDLEKTTNMDIEQTEVDSESTLRLWAVDQKITGKTVDSSQGRLLFDGGTDACRRLGSFLHEDSSWAAEARIEGNTTTFFCLSISRSLIFYQRCHHSSNCLMLP